MAPSQTDAKALRAAIKSGSFAPAYYLHGEDDYVKEEDVRRAIDAAVDPATRDFNLEILRGAEVDAERLGSILNTPPMMAERRVVVVRDVPSLKKDARAALDKYLRQPSPDVLLLLVSPSGAKADTGLAARAESIEYQPLSGARIPKWINYHVEHDLGSTITPDAVDLLQESVGTGLADLKIELDKLVSFTSGGTIDAAAVSAVVGVRAGETMGDLLDSVAQRDAVRALAMLPSVMQQPKSGGVPVVLALTVQMLGIGWVQARRQRGANPGRLYSEMMNLLKETGAYPWRAWKEYINTCIRAADEWPPRDVDRSLERLLQTDVALKTTRLSSDEELIASLVLSLCGATSQRRVA